MTDRPASPPTNYETGCRSKHTYATKAAAKRAARLTETRFGVRRLPGKGRLAPYRCDHCGFFHVGHPTLRLRRTA